MNSITKFAVKYPVSVLMITLAICLLGTISYNKLGTDLFPDLKNPALYVEVKCGQRPPEEIEKQFISSIEGTTARQEGVNNVYSICKVGYAKITVEYDWNQDMDAAFLDLQRALSGQKSDGIDEINVTRYDANATPILTVALTHNEITDMNELRKVAENYMRNELVRVDGIADIQLNGQENATVEISTDSYMLKAFNLTANDIAGKIEKLSQSVSGGSIEDGDIIYNVKGINLVKSIEDLENIIVAFKETTPSSSNSGTGSGNTNNTASKNKAPVYLKDVAKVTIRNQEPENIARYNGERCLGISVFKENKYNTVNAVDNLLAKISDFQKSMPNYNFHIISNQGDFIGSSINEVKNSALLGIILAVIILYIFLRRINMTLIVSISIPISIIATFNLMYFNGLSINIMTLGGLALGAGMLVDNAIVVMENIFRNLDENKLSPKEAAVQGTSEVAGAITASTLTTIVVFLPIVYLQGAAGELFKEQAWTVSFSLLSSLFVSILFIPMLASKFVKKSQGKSQAISIKGYGNFVGRILHKKYTVILGAFIIMVVSYLMLPLIGMEFMPKSDSKEFTITLSLEPGLRLKNTDNATSGIEETIRSLGGEEIDWVYTLVGPSKIGSENGEKVEEENQAQIKVRLKENSKLNAEYFISHISKEFPLQDGMEISYQQGESALQSILGTEGAPLVIEIKGEELDVLDDLCNDIKQKITGITGIYDIKTSMEDGVPEVNIKIDRIKSGIYGINIEDVTSQVKEKLQGKEAGTFENNGENIAVNIKVPEISLSDLNNIEINQNNKIYRLGELAEISFITAPKEIARTNQSRTGKVTAMIEKGYTLGHIAPQVREKLAEVDFPAKYTAQLTGEEEMRKESFGGLGFALLLSIILVYMVMAAQFESLRHPFTILLTIPLAGVGCIWAFLLTGDTLNMMAFIGVIMLAGIAVNSSIILVDAINRLKEEGHELEEAIMMAAQFRIRPIIMTSATTILALLPMCFGFGEGASLRSPMALAVIGGLATSTVMTLIVIPCVYYVIDKKKKVE